MSKHNSRPKSLAAMQLVMHHVAHQAHARAESIARRLEHGTFNDVHALVGILIEWKETETSKSRLLRDCGVSYDKLLLFLEQRAELQNHSRSSLQYSKYAQRTFARAVRIAKRRSSKSETATVFTIDMLKAILRSRDPLFKEAIFYTSIDKPKLLKLLKRQV